MRDEKTNDKKTCSPLGIVPVRHFIMDSPLKLESGATLDHVEIAYETCGTLNADRSNAILLCHALSGDAHVAGISGETGKAGWWESLVGPGKPFDTDRYFIICSNVIGGCRGTTGPMTVNPATGEPWGFTFPEVTIRDMAEAQVRLVRHLGIEKLRCLAGGSMGGMQVLQWVHAHPDMVDTAIIMATTLRHTPQQIAFNEVGRQAIMGDPGWLGGNYYGVSFPSAGLAVARMVGHITYMSDISMQNKFGRRQVDPQKLKSAFDTGFEVEGYLRYQGEAFIQRFDANSYLYITRAIDCFDLGDNQQLVKHFLNCPVKFLVLSYSHDWLYPPQQSREIVRVLKYAMADVTYCDITSTFGHDAFLIENPEQETILRSFLANSGHEGSARP